MTQLAPLLHTDPLTCHRDELLLFKNLSIHLCAGEALKITGANGAGKSSLLRILCGLLQPTQGQIYWRGQPLQHILNDYYAEIIYVGHKLGIKLNLTVAENLKLFTTLHNYTIRSNNRNSLLGLDNYLNIPVVNLSAGQRQRLALLRTIYSSAKLWLLDEPFTSLDQQTIHLVKNIFLNHLEQGGMIVTTTHQPLELPQFKQLNIPITA